MHSFTAVALTALVASASIVSAAPIACRGKPDGYVDGYLEDYETYHSRYLALGCSDQHGSTFFDDCCHPLLANESLVDTRLSYCIPSNATVADISATIAPANATATASADVDAAAEYSAASTSAEVAEATATSSVAAVAEVAQQTAEPTTSASSSTEEWVAPSTTSSAEAEATTSAAASSGSGDVKTGGFATFFYQGGNAGACGTVHSDSDYVIAIDSNGYWSDFSQPSEYCGRSIAITNTNNGKTVTAVVADVCPTCVSDNSLDLSVGAFTAIASEADGSVPITWQWA